MGLLDKVTAKKVDTENLTKEEVQFILNKMRASTYKGDEFEQFFHVFKKLTDYLNSLNK